MSSGMRKAAFAVAWVVAAMLLFAAFARPGVEAPLSPAHTLVSDPNTWETAAADVRVEGAGIVVRGADAAGNTLLLQPVTPFNAAGFRYLAYDVEVEDTDKAHFLWRVGGQLRTAPLPRAAGGNGTIDLHAVPGWEGEIDAIGVAATPTDVLNPFFVAQREFALRSMRLSSPSWKGALAVLWNEWTAYRPWTGRSNNTGGFELSAKAGPSLSLYAALLAAVALLLALAFFGREAARRAIVPVVGLAVLWLGGVQLAQLSGRGAAASSAAARAEANPELPLAAQPQLAAAARTVSARLKEEAGRPRVFVAGENQFLGEYSTWLLREHDAALVATLDAMPAKLDAASFLVLAGNGPWQFDIASGRLSLGERHWLGELVHDAGVLRAYRVSAWEDAP